jgi:hypothetical protein
MKEIVADRVVNWIHLDLSDGNWNNPESCLNQTLNKVLM